MRKNERPRRCIRIQGSERGVLALLSVLLGFFVLELFVNPVMVSAEVLNKTNSATIHINDFSNNTPAAPYPSSIAVSGLTQQVAHVTVTLWGLQHTFSSDLSMLLVGPQGQSVVLMSQTGEGLPISVGWMTFDDAAAIGLPYIGKPWSITNGVYKPTDAENPNYFVPPAPSAPYSTALSAFNATVPNGTWSLYVEDEGTDNSGIITNGWSLNIVTAPFYDGINLNDPTQLIADWDGDGMANLLEYALGSNPNNPADDTAGFLPQIVAATGSNYVDLTYKQRVDAAARQLQYFPEVSGDRQTWFSDAGHLLQVSVTPFDSQFNRVTVRDLTPITAAAPRFVRLRVVNNATQATSPAWVGSDTLILGNGGSGSKLTLFSPRSVRPVQYAGKVSSVLGATLTDTNATWSDGQFGTNGSLAYVEFDNGWMADISDSSAADQSLTLADSLLGIASPGNNYRIRSHWTAASLLGTNNETGFKPGRNPSEGDNVLLLNPETQSMVTLFYYSNSANPGFTGWVRADTFTPDANEIIYPEQGVMVLRSTPGDLHLTLCGPLQTGVAVVPIQPGYNLVGTLHSLSSIVLSNLNLYTGDSSTGVVPGLNPGTADNLLVIGPNSSVTTYFYYYSRPDTFQGWVNAGFVDSGGVGIPAGSAFFILRQQLSGFHWTIPAQ